MHTNSTAIFSLPLPPGTFRLLAVPTVNVAAHKKRVKTQKKETHQPGDTQEHLPPPSRATGSSSYSRRMFFSFSYFGHEVKSALTAVKAVLPDRSSNTCPSLLPGVAFHYYMVWNLAK
ncbi:unnamed protein product [Ectocarpus sp. 8 AP-2014]